ncbi:hypothetical protein BDV18DRAFT_138133 [Aspergillus unguis]
MARYSYGYGYYGDASCSEYAFQETGTRVDLAFAALYFLVSLGLFLVATAAFSRARRHLGRVSGSLWLTLSVFLAMGGHLTNIIYITLRECVITAPWNLWTAALAGNWLFAASQYILVAVIMTTLCSKVQRDTSSSVMLASIVNKVWVAVLGALIIAAMSIGTVQAHYTNSTDTRFDIVYELYNPSRGVWTTYYALAVAGILLAVATMGKTLGGASNALKMWVLVLSVCALGHTVTNLGIYIENTYAVKTIESYGEYKKYERGNEAANFLSSFFYSVAFFAAVKIASHRGVAKNQPVAEYAPGYGYDNVHGQDHGQDYGQFQNRLGSGSGIEGGQGPVRY